MPLHPQVQDYLDRAAALGGTPPEELPLAEARRQMEESCAALGEPPRVTSIEDRSIPGPAGKIGVRIFRSMNDGISPAVVFFHGGGWVLGSINTHDKLCREIALASGAVVVSVEYRLAPEHKFPAAAEDAYAATCWVAEHARELGGDPARVIVAGDSAGGNLAAVVSLMACDRGNPRLARQVLIYPITDFDFQTPSYRDNAEGYFLTRASMEWFWREYLPRAADGEHPYSSPLRAADLSGLPPALILTAEYDPLRDEAEAYAGRLKSAGVPVELIRYDGQIHGFLRRTAFFDQARVAMEQLGEVIKSSGY